MTALGVPEPSDGHLAAGLLHAELPIHLAPLAGVRGSALAIAVSNAGELGALAAGTSRPDAITFFRTPWRRARLQGGWERARGLPGPTCAVAWEEATMNGTAKRLLYGAPRVPCIVFAAFISIFAVDVFQEGVPVWQVALALPMHLLPTILVLLVLALSWRREWVGGALFIALGSLYLLWARNKPFFG